MKTLTARRVRRARRIIARDRCNDRPFRHRWVYLGFWHRCLICGEVS